MVSNSFSASISASFGVTGANVVSPGIYSITRLDTDSGSLLLKVTYADGIGSQSVFTKDITYTKAKNAIPTTIALLSSETQTVLSSSTIAAPSTFTVSVNEGGSNYTYDAALSAVNTFYISTITGGTNTSAVVTPTTPTTDSGTTVALTISYKNSITGTGTINKNHIVSVSKKGDIGTTGTTGGDGKRAATGMVHYQLSSATAPSTPSATAYTFSSNTFTSLTANWAVGAPIFSGSNSSKYWYSTYNAIETTSGGGTAAPTFSTPSQAIGFTGLVTFTSTDKITDGTNVTNIASTSSVTNHIGGPNVTTINGGKISTGTITSTQYTLLGADTLTSGTFMGEGTIFNLDNSGSIRSKNFYITPQGDAFFKGDVTGASGTFSGTVSGATISGGTISGTTISGTTITGGTLSGTTITGGTINIGPNKFIVDSSGNATVGQTLNVTGDVIIRGWKDVLASGMDPQSITAGGNFEFRDPDTTSTVMGFLRGYKTIYNQGVPGLERIERNTVLTALDLLVVGQYSGNPWATLNGTKLQVWGDVVANYSDGRLKNIEGRIENPLEKIQKLNGVYYTQNKLAEDFGFKNKKRQIGLIAQEVNEVLPEVIDLAPFDSLGQTNQSKSGENYMTLNYERIVPLLVECIKELKSEIEELKRNR